MEIHLAIVSLVKGALESTGFFAPTSSDAVLLRLAARCSSTLRKMMDENFILRIEHIAGKENSFADFLSRIDNLWEKNMPILEEVTEVENSVQGERIGR